MASLRTLWISLLAALMLAAAPTASAIVDGTVDVERDYVVFVGQQVVIPGGPTINTVACSGVLVAPTVVVTAAHCSLMGPPVPPSWIRWVVIRGEGIGTPDAMQASGSFVVHPSFCIACPGAPEGFANNDLAVVLLDNPLPGPYAKLPKADFVGKHFDKEKKLVAAGYGITGPGLRDVGPAGRLRPAQSSRPMPRTSCSCRSRASRSTAPSAPATPAARRSLAR